MSDRHGFGVDRLVPGDRGDWWYAFQVVAVFYLAMGVITVGMHLWLGLTHWFFLANAFFLWPSIFPYESAWPLLLVASAIEAGYIVWRGRSVWS